MIDTNDQRKVQYRLRRVGRPATKSSVKDIMKLTKDITRFGRHSGNDYYLDSAKLDCFISRWHAEIHKVMKNGQIQYVLRDNSLNGTYVNNYRVLGSHHLKNGEIICFGHTNGKNLKPGDYAPQTDSEFEFIFEEYIQEEAEDTGHNILQSQNRVNHPVVDSTTDVHSTVSHQTSLAQCKDTSTNVMQTSCIENMITAKLESVTSPSTDKSSNSGADSPVQHDSSLKSNSPTVAGFLPLEQYAIKSNGEDKTSTPHNITVRVIDEVTSEVRGHQQLKSSASTPVSQHTKPHKEERSKSELTPSASSESFMSPAQSKPSRTSKSSTKKRKMTDASNISSSKKKARGSVTKDKKHRPTAAEVYEDDDEDEGEEDSSWHYDGEKCDAPHCKRPKTKKVSWVQCDDCDDWYHTQCAGCRYDKVKQANAEFHCGCLEKS